MTKNTVVLALACTAVLSGVVAAQTPAGSMSAPTLPGAEKWIDIPAAAMVGTPSVPVGGTLKVAILQGDPMTPGKTYVARVSCSAGAKVAPHTHPTTENVTVIKGTFLMGMGTKWDDAKLSPLPAGAFGSMEPGFSHFAACKGDTVVQINGIAPLQFTFVK